VETLTLTSKVFGNTRSIRVLLPPEYGQTDRAYPVLYLNDGLTVFREKAIDIGSIPSLPPIIVVGIDNGASTDTSSKDRDDRAIEYLPYPDAGFPPAHTYAPDPADPRGKSYPRFLIDEVMPLIEGKYRVLRGPSNTAIGGFSYGGVAALYTVIAEPGIFGKLLLESTPLWIGEDRQLLQDARQLKAWPASVYIGVGSAEAPDEAINAEGRKDIDSLLAIINRNSHETRVKYAIEPNATHGPAAWRRRLPAALQFLFGPTSPRQP
jgi:predicted alpha/beta superfamily hydrolase